MSGIDPHLVNRTRKRLSKYTSRGTKTSDAGPDVDIDVLTVDRPFEARLRPEASADGDAAEDEGGDRPRRTTPREEPGKLLTALRKALQHPMSDYGFLLGALALILGLGLIMVLSASTVYSLTRVQQGSYAVFVRQLMFAGIGIALMLLASRMPVTFYRRIATPLLVVSIVLLILVLVPGIGKSINGQQNWISLGGPFQLQPSEFAKVALALWCAEALFRNRDRLDTMRGLLMPLLPVAGVVFVLVLLEKDLGTCFILVPIVGAMLYVAGAPRKIFAWGGVGFLLTIVAMTIAAPYRAARFASWLNPDANADGIGYQIIHGHYALATGGWWGVGLGASREKWGFLPEAHTDFILAVIGEELGLIGTFSVLGLFALLGWVIVQIALKSDSLFVRLATTGIGAWIIVQALINMGAVLGILPIVGVPLPMVSYGGSSLIFTLCAMGVLLAFARSQPEARKYLRERKAAKLSAQGRRTRSRPTRRSERQERARARTPERPDGAERPNRPSRRSRIRPNDSEAQTAAAEAPRRTLRRGTPPPPPEPIQAAARRRTSRRSEEPEEIDLRDTTVFESDPDAPEKSGARGRRRRERERAKQPQTRSKGESVKESKPKRGWRSKRDIQAEERAAAREAEAAIAPEAPGENSRRRSSRSSRRNRKDED